MKKSILLTALILSSFFSLQNCSVCDECIGIAAPKELKFINTNGDNLIFGAKAIYNPNLITIKNNFGELIEFSKNQSNGTLDFEFNVKANTYFIKLSSTDNDNIQFTYTKDKHIDCCTEFDITQTTKVNGTLVSNEDKIVIIK